MSSRLNRGLGILGAALLLLGTLMPASTLVTTSSRLGSFGGTSSLSETPISMALIVVLLGVAGFGLFRDKRALALVAGIVIALYLSSEFYSTVTFEERARRLERDDVSRGITPSVRTSGDTHFPAWIVMLVGTSLVVCAGLPEKTLTGRTTSAAPS